MMGKKRLEIARLRVENERLRSALNEAVDDGHELLDQIVTLRRRLAELEARLNAPQPVRVTHMRLVPFNPADNSTGTEDWYA